MSKRTINIGRDGRKAFNPNSYDALGTRTEVRQLKKFGTTSDFARVTYYGKPVYNAYALDACVVCKETDAPAFAGKVYKGAIRAICHVCSLEYIEQYRDARRQKQAAPEPQRPPEPLFTEERARELAALRQREFTAKRQLRERLGAEKGEEMHNPCRVCGETVLVSSSFTNTVNVHGTRGGDSLGRTLILGSCEHEYLASIPEEHWGRMARIPREDMWGIVEAWLDL